jgi:hypothetical protein
MRCGTVHLLLQMVTLVEGRAALLDAESILRSCEQVGLSWEDYSR